MTVNEKLYARLRFKLELLERNAQSFQDLFTKVMTAHCSSFEPVKPYGNMGDRKNDGFNPDTGTYYQVYAPEDPSTNKLQAIQKLHKDFEGLFKNWNHITPINTFYFAVNDKFVGMGPFLHEELKKIEGNYPTVKCKPFYAHHLMEVFMSLPEEHIYSLIGNIPDPTEIEPFESHVMNDVVRYLLGNFTQTNTTPPPKDPDFDLKLRFNKLSEHPATCLKFAGYQYGDLRDFFATSVDVKEKLKEIFNGLYKKALSDLPDTEDRNDLVFYYILNKAHPKASERKDIYNAVLVLMSYYFSACDIFEDPRKPIQGTFDFLKSYAPSN
ncbi:ABC-three component system protein [Tellurirhabdus rosea]|uniref:ABC-three component system protein n=1 Tax=Tellurirhabdus rosea TaxID=2674997 RepID=UPI00224CA895|nr:ABC-three component system protein [Tellurirhabdus rosea]